MRALLFLLLAVVGAVDAQAQHAPGLTAPSREQLFIVATGRDCPTCGFVLNDYSVMVWEKCRADITVEQLRRFRYTDPAYFEAISYRVTAQKNSQPLPQAYWQTLQRPACPQS